MGFTMARSKDTSPRRTIYRLKYRDLLEKTHVVSILARTKSDAWKIVEAFSDFNRRN